MVIIISRVSPTAAPAQDAGTADRETTNASSESSGRAEDEMVLVEIAEAELEIEQSAEDDGGDEEAVEEETGSEDAVIDQLLTGGAGSDQLSGGVGNDTIIGNAGDDVLAGEDGDDRLEGGAGDDQLIGGNGTGDVAVFRSDVRNYEIDLAGGTITDTDLSDGDAGRDTFSGIEILEFKDRSVFLDSRDNIPLAFDDELATDEDSPLTITVANLLSNDIEFDGETLSVASVGSAVNGTVTLQAVASSSRPMRSSSAQRVSSTRSPMAWALIWRRSTSPSTK